MIEQGLQLLVQGNAAVVAIAAAGGGFTAQLPKNFPLPSWTQTLITDPTDYNMQGPVDLGNRTVQIDCYASTADDALSLAAAIDAVLSGYRGQLADDDAVFVQACFRTDQRDFFDGDPREYRRGLVYNIFSSSVAP
jgi:hypothetical protein